MAAFTSTQDLALRCALDAGDLKAQASADALQSLSGHRRQQVWDAAALKPASGLLRGVPVDEDELQLPSASEGEEVVFVTLEDETGSVNVIVWKAVKEQFRDVVYRARLMAGYGVWQRDEATGGQVRHVIAKRLVDMTPHLGELETTSRDFH